MAYFDIFFRRRLITLRHYAAAAAIIISSLFIAAFHIFHAVMTLIFAFSPFFAA